MSKLGDYLEALNLEPRMSSEDSGKIDRYKHEIERLRRTGDDSGVKAEIREVQTKIKQIKDKYTTADEKVKNQEQAKQNYINRSEKNRLTRNKEAKTITEKYNNLSEEDKAREAIVALRNFTKLRVAQHQPVKQKEFVVKVKQAQNEIVALYKLEKPSAIKSQFSLKEKAGNIGNLKAPEKIKTIYKKYKIPSKYV